MIVEKKQGREADAMKSTQAKLRRGEILRRIVRSAKCALRCAKGAALRMTNVKRRARAGPEGRRYEPAKG
ncbi:MAG: hypothetical protein WBG29_04440, partial [Candidatus Acidiferrales bacterium]